MCTYALPSAEIACPVHMQALCVLAEAEALGPHAMLQAGVPGFLASLLRSGHLAAVQAWPAAAGGGATAARALIDGASYALRVPFAAFPAAAPELRPFHEVWFHMMRGVVGVLLFVSNLHAQGT